MRTSTAARIPKPPSNPFRRPVVDIRIARARRYAVDFLDELRIDYEDEWEAFRVVREAVTYGVPSSEEFEESLRGFGRGEMARLFETLKGEGKL